MEPEKSAYQMEIVNRIRQMRFEHNVSQIEIATWLGISNGQVGNIESGKYRHKYTLKQLKCICDNFHISIATLLLDCGEPQTIDNVINKIIEYYGNE